MKNYPLNWPDGWRRTETYQRSPGHFCNKGNVGHELTIGNAVDRVLDELRRMGIRDYDAPIISSNLAPTLGGRPLSKQGQPKDPGVAVYWKKSNEAVYKVMAIDRYTKVEQNLAAIAATLEAMRAIERHGGAQILERAFKGFVALPPPKDWASYFGLTKPTTMIAVRAMYRAKAKDMHPDTGGSHAEMAELNDMLAMAEKELGG